MLEMHLTAISGNAPGAAWLVARVSCFQITEILLCIGNIFSSRWGYGFKHTLIHQ